MCREYIAQHAFRATIQLFGNDSEIKLSDLWTIGHPMDLDINGDDAVLRIYDSTFRPGWLTDNVS